MGCGSGSLRCFRHRSPAVIAIPGAGRSMTGLHSPGIVFVLTTGITWKPAAHQPGQLLRGDLLAAAAGLDRRRRLAGPA